MAVVRLTDVLGNLKPEVRANQKTLYMRRIAIFISVLTLTVATKAQQSYEITFNHDGKTVYGTFTVPDTSGQFPTVIINPGTGANDRDGTIPMIGANAACLYPDLLNETLKPYKQLSAALVDSGYAVLRYDKLEYTYPTPAALGNITFHKLWLPVESAIDYVKTRNDVDTSNIILLGHSEGSSIIPYIAKSRSDIKAMVSIAGPRTPLDSLFAYQLVFIADTCNGNIGQAQTQANQILSYFNIIRTNTWNAGTPPFSGVSASTWYEYIHAIDSVAINYNLANLPTLFTGLGLDINVPPSELIRFQNEVTVSNDFWNIPGLNHYMTTNNDPNVSTALTDTIIYWLRQEVITTGVASLNNENISLHIYPNPFSSEFTITINEPKTKELEIIVRNTFGQEVIREQHGISDRYFNRTFNLNSVANGVYLISIIANGQQMTRKVIKQ